MIATGAKTGLAQIKQIEPFLQAATCGVRGFLRLCQSWLAIS
jgi:hypothetical protein